jgi:hypothetical protein
MYNHQPISVALWMMMTMMMVVIMMMIEMMMVIMMMVVVMMIIMMMMMIATTAAYLPLAAFSSTSWKASNIRMVLLNPSAAVLAE